jgi:hypothetical protein
MIIHPLTTLVLFCSLTTATVRTFDRAFGESIELCNFSKAKITKIIDESMSLDSYHVKNYLKTFKIYSDPSLEPPSSIDFYYQFFKFLHPRWLVAPKKRDTVWRKIFDQLLKEKSNLKPPSKNPLVHQLNFLSFCGILNEEYKDEIFLSNFNIHVSRLIGSNFGIPFSFSLENTYLKLIYCYFAIRGDKSLPAHIFVESQEGQSLVGNHSNVNYESRTDIVLNPTHQRFVSPTSNIQWEDNYGNIEYESSYNNQNSISEEITTDYLPPSSNYLNDEIPIQPIRREEGLSKMSISSLLN